MCNNENVANSSSVNVKTELTLAEKLKHHLLLRNHAAETVSLKAEETVLSKNTNTTFTVTFPLSLDSKILRVYFESEGYKIIEVNNNTYKLQLNQIQKAAKEKLKKISDYIKETYATTIAIDAEIYFRVEVGKINAYEEEIIRKFSKQLGFDNCSIKKETDVVLYCNK